MPTIHYQEQREMNAYNLLAWLLLLNSTYLLLIQFKGTCVASKDVHTGMSLSTSINLSRKILSGKHNLDNAQLRFVTGEFNCLKLQLMLAITLVNINVLLSCGTLLIYIFLCGPGTINWHPVNSLVDTLQAQCREPNPLWYIDFVPSKRITFFRPYPCIL